ncbi:major capsid protein [Pseudomonas nitroreducens]|uniref:major capsid protein n=1 Tax=Pseudomonas nitroreducens TaxID=46680 RepID=UPI003D2B1C61
MKALQSINPVRSFRNLCIAGVVGMSASAPTWAASVIDTSAVETAMADGKTDMATIGGYVVGALVVLAVAGLIYSMLRKA